MSSITEDIKSRIDVVDLIKEYVQLIPSGVNFKARCPFHNEKTPSFYVSAEKQIWHCFGCGAGGDIFEFIKRIEGLEFPEALRILADKANVKLDHQYSPEFRNQKTKVLDILELSAKYYHQLLLNDSEAQEARTYLKKRAIDKETISQFNLGYSKDSWNDLLNYLKKQGFREMDIEASGLILKSKKDGKFYDRFRGRLMFPINNIFGQGIGFTARILKPDKQQGKYINTPQTIAYDKSSVLYNMDLAKLSIKQKNYTILVEGQVDVMSSYMMGVKNVVASSGTALTHQQVKILKRYSPNLMIAYDADQAGLKATFRIIDNALLEGMNIKVIKIPAGMDPDQLIKTDPEKWLEIIKNAEPIMDFVFQQVLSSGNLENVFHKKQVVQKILVFISKFRDDIERETYLRRLSDLVGVEYNLLRGKLKDFLARRQHTYTVQNENNKEYQPVQLNKKEELLKKIIALSLNFTNNIEYLVANLELEYVDEGLVAELYKNMVIYYTKNGVLDLESFKKTLNKEQSNLLDVIVFIFENEYSGSNQNKSLVVIQDLVKAYKQEFLNKKSVELQILINKAKESKDLDLENKYFCELNDVNLKKKSLK